MDIEEPPPVARCQFIIPRKNRTCRMLVKPNRKYCGEHALADPYQQDRVICPLDGNHSVNREDLDDHVKRCNSRLRTDFPWIIENVNAPSPAENLHKSEQHESSTSIKDMSSDQLESFVIKIDTLYDKFVKNLITTDYQRHAVFDDVLNSSSIYTSPVQRKHFIQQSSIIGHMIQLGLMEDFTTFVEFGAGRAKLSYWLNKCLLQTENVRFVTVEKSGQRYKFENKAVRESESEYVSSDESRFCRYRCAVEHFDLRRIPSLVTSSSDDIANVVAVCKHLCGSGTDAAIRAIINCRESSPDGAVRGVDVRGSVFAPCCHHRCTWEEFVGQSAFNDFGLSDLDFFTVCQMTSWATCGLNPTTTGQKGATTFDREKTGRNCKAILDYCRNRYLIDNGFRAQLKYFVDVSVTPENLLLLITPEESLSKKD